MNTWPLSFLYKYYSIIFETKVVFDRHSLSFYRNWYFYLVGICLEFWLSFLQRNIRNLSAKEHLLLKKNPENRETSRHSVPKGSDSFSSSLFYHWITYFLGCSLLMLIFRIGFICLFRNWSAIVCNTSSFLLVWQERCLEIVIQILMRESVYHNLPWIKNTQE